MAKVHNMTGVDMNRCNTLGPIAWFSLLLLFFASPGALTADLNPAQRAQVEALTSEFMEAGKYPSVTLVIDQGGSTLYSLSKGFANLEYDIESGMDSAYAMGSITKSFTALATLQLASEDRLSLDEPVGTYLPEYQGPARKVTIRRLLDHTSGIPNYTNLPGLNPKLRRTAYSREQMVDFFEDLPLEFTPGEKFNYTNSGYYLLGLIIEAVTGHDYYDALDQQIFKPLGLTHTYSGDDSEIISGRVNGYNFGEKGFTNAPTWSHLAPFAAGSLITTVSDLVQYRRGVFHSEKISPKLRKMLTQTNPLNDGTANLYAQGGLIVSEVDGHKKLSHSGDIWGFAADHAFYPDDDITIVILTNHQAEAPSVVSLEQKIARVVFGLPQPEILDLTLDPSEVKRLEGDYLLHPFIFGPPRYGFIAQEGKLFLRFGGIDAPGPMLPLLAQGNGKFVAAWDDEWRFRFKDNGRPARSFESNARDGTFFGQRQSEEK